MVNDAWEMIGMGRPIHNPSGLGPIVAMLVTLCLGLGSLPCVAAPSPAVAPAPLVLGEAHSSDNAVTYTVALAPEATGTLPSSTAPTKRVLLNRMISLSVQAQARPASGPPPVLKLTAFDARMPAHNHGMNVVPSVTSLGPNQWRVDGVKLHMAGSWLVSLNTERNGQPELVNFEVHL